MLATAPGLEDLTLTITQEIHVNAPLETADRIITGEGSRAEIQFDPGNMIHATDTNGLVVINN